MYIHSYILTLVSCFWRFLLKPVVVVFIPLGINFSFRFMYINCIRSVKLFFLFPDSVSVASLSVQAIKAAPFTLY